MPDISQRLELLYREYFKDIYRYVYYHVNNVGDAEDVTQDVFIKALQGWRKFEERSSARTWMFTIARHAIIDWRRRMDLRRTAAIEDIPDPVSEEDVEQDYLVRERNGLLSRALQELPNTYRDVVLLRLVEGLSVEEVGRVLGWSAAKVKVTLHRAIKKLRTTLNESQLFEGHFDGGENSGRQAQTL